MNLAPAMFELSGTGDGEASFQDAIRQLVAANVADLIARLAPQPPAVDPDQLLTAQQVAELCNVSTSQVRGWMRSNLATIMLPGSGTGARAQRRVQRSDLLAWIEAHREVRS